jgi:predicted AAA+ superfamily ATPase
MERGELVALALTRLRNSPAVALLGPRQVGKTTLAAQIAAAWRGPTTRFDLENPEQVRRFDEPMAILEPLRGLVVLDEIQRRPELFPALRVLADRPKKPARFLVLGSASPELLRQTSESLAGRIHYVTIDGFALDEVGESRLDRLWLRGGFPLSFLARSDAESFRWRRDFIQTFLERDLAQLGFRTPADTLFRFWTMLAHYHGQIWNASEFGRAFGVSDVTVRHYLDVLAATLVVRVLQPWHQNIAKRQVKAPKIYISDSGLVHALLNLPTRDDLVVHPKVGASWEGFILGQLVRRLGVRPEECHFWGTQQGAELDLLVVRGRRRLGFEIKHSRAPAVSRSMLIAGEDLRLDSVDVIHSGTDTYMLRKGVRAVAARRLLEDVKPVGA